MPREKHREMCTRSILKVTGTRGGKESRGKGETEGEWGRGGRGVKERPGEERVLVADSLIVNRDLQVFDDLHQQGWGHDFIFQTQWWAELLNQIRQQIYADFLSSIWIEDSPHFYKLVQLVFADCL